MAAMTDGWSAADWAVWTVKKMADHLVVLMAASKVEMTDENLAVVTVVGRVVDSVELLVVLRVEWSGEQAAVLMELQMAELMVC